MSEKRSEKFQERLRYRMHNYCDAVELALAMVVGLVLILNAGKYLVTFLGFAEIESDTSLFQSFLKNIFNLVVGIEFIKMLLKPHAKNVIDVLIFLIARHLIIGNSSPIGMFLCVLSIILLYGFLFVIKYMRAKDSDFKKAMDTPFAEAHEAYIDLKEKQDTGSKK